MKKVPRKQMLPGDLIYEAVSERRQLKSARLRFRGTAVSYRFTRAPAPPMMASTSDTEAMEVSPGVVIASAPWAAP